MKKAIKTLSIVFVLAIILATFCVSAVDLNKLDDIQPQIKNDGVWVYKLDARNNTAKIYGYIGSDKDVVIPEIIEDEYAVTELVLNSEDVFYWNDTFPIFGTQANFETLTIPKTLKLISNYFSSVYYEDTGDSKEFRQMKEGKLKYNGKVIMKGFFDCEPLHNLKAFIVDEENPYFSSKDGVLYNKDQSVLIRYPWGKSEKKFEVPNTVKQIMPYAIDGYASIEEIVINENVEKLGVMCIGDAATYQKISSTRFESYLQIPNTANRTHVKILNNNLEEEQLSLLFNYSGIGDSKFKLTVYKDSPADKYFSRLSKSEYTIVEIVKRLANPYAKEEPEKDKTSSKSVSSKNTSSKNTSSKTNQSPAPDTTESVVSKPEKTEETTESEVLTIGATESETTTENKNETKPEKSSNVWIIIAIAAAIVILAGGGTAYWFIRKKKKA